MKVCAHCRFLAADALGGWLCGHSESKSVDPIIGDIHWSCARARNQDAPCGPEGKLFELKWWRRILCRLRNHRYHYRPFTEEEKQRMEQRNP